MSATPPGRVLRLAVLAISSCSLVLAAHTPASTAPATVSLARPQVSGWTSDSIRAVVGKPLRIRVALTPAPGPMRVKLRLRPAGSRTWRSVWSATTSPRGRVAVRIPTDRPFTGWARVSFAGGGSRTMSVARRLVVAAPDVGPEVEDGTPIPAELEAEVLRLVNVARSQTRWCGPTEMVATTPLRHQPVLGVASRAYALRMATENFFDHTDPSGGSPWDRATAAGYTGALRGENIAYGYGSPHEVMKGWLTSPGHCMNLMSPHADELGVGYATAPGGSRPYWVQMFGSATRSCLGARRSQVTCG